MIVVQGGFHGRTYLTMAMTTSKVGVRAGYQPLPAGHLRDVVPAPVRVGCRRGDRGRARARRSSLLLLTQTAPGETAAFVMEPVLGEGGYLPAPIAFVRGVAEICAEHGILFVADEVQTGFARTGRMFAVEHSGVEPDIMVMAKGIASGFPIAAIGARAELMARWNRGAHGGTYGANPMGCAAALATIDVILDEQLVLRSAATGRQLSEGLRALQSRHAGVGDVRALGLMVAAELTRADGSPDAGAHQRGAGALPAGASPGADVVWRRLERGPVHAAARGERGRDRLGARRLRCRPRRNSAELSAVSASVDPHGSRTRTVPVK